jgi:polar amino acid transport system permease protein/polar amino acid transport system substrate-binding protein
MRAAALRLGLQVILLPFLAGPCFPQDSAPLKIGLDPRSAPWAFVPGADYSSVDFRTEPSLSRAEVDKVTGLDVDVSRALARELGRRPVFVPVGYYRLEQALLRGEIDLVVNAWNRTRETPASIRESEPYCFWGLLVAARADDARLKSAADLRGKRVGHFESKLVNQTLHSLGAAELKTYDNETMLFADLKAGAIDAVVYDSPAVRWRARNDRAIHAVGEPLNKLGYHVAVRAGDEALFARVQGAVRALTRSGALAAIQSRWE